MNIYYLLANDTVDDIIWYVLNFIFPTQLLYFRSSTEVSFSIFLLCRDVVQGKLENLGQVCYLSLSLPVLALAYYFQHFITSIE